ncbi:LrgB family protein [Tatumella ptyseos]|uniref:LrgB family protein n=1 Tax=Tatumella ptyseos TaxID=82987 RepID=UPI0026EA57FA|nr:LrgB family protein [Tatumella ptyseos]WKX26162.1 LrgB family protein [Tatumella ptyseos]
MSSMLVNIGCLVLTVIIYYLNKRLYRRWRLLLLMPLVFTPLVLIILLLTTPISWEDYIGDNHWLIWLLGPATLAFAVPVYENLGMIRRHWMSLGAGVLTAVTVAVFSSVWLARLFSLPEMVERSLAVRSITTPFALAAAKQVGGQPDLVALFVVITGVFGMAIGDFLFLRLMIKQSIAKGASLGAASHGAGTAKAYQLGPEEGVVSSLVMMLAGIMTVLLAPFIRLLF